jgi:phasin
MTKTPYQIPPEIRDMTAKSVEEARKAFERFAEAARTATARAEEATGKVQAGFKDAGAKAVDFTESHVKAAFDHVQKLIQAKDPQEFLAHQTEYLTKQMAALEEHAKELGSAIIRKVTPDK